MERMSEVYPTGHIVSAVQKSNRSRPIRPIGK
jgi:hypothetical protein